jgi:hypothetical protein
MSSQYNNLPPGYNPGYFPYNYYKPKEEFSLLTGVYIGVGIAALVILAYIYWTYTVYRYSSERVGDKLLTKFKLLHKNDDPPVYVDDDVKYVSHDSGLTDLARTNAHTNIIIKDKVNQNVLGMTSFQASISDTCSPMSSSCIRL